MTRRIEVLTAVLATVGIVAVASAASSPSVVTGGTTGISTNGATMHGTVNPNGSATSYYFEWGLTTAYGVTGHVHKAGNGTKPVKVQATVGMLIPGTVYHYNVVATNRFGTGTGADRTFKTAGSPPPDATTGPATQIGATFATVTGVINPHGAATTWFFEYGVTGSYGTQTFSGTVPAGSAPVTVSWQLTGLSPATIFHYRLAASHSTPQSGMDGLDATFMTTPSRRPYPRVRARTTPHRARKKPYVFTTAGNVVPPRWIPAAYGCGGATSIQFFLGRRRVAFTLAPLASDCSFSAQTTFARLPGRGKKHRKVTLRVLIRYLGDGYLAPLKARPETVVLG
jgi:hypothetical protein